MLQVQLVNQHDPLSPRARARASLFFNKSFLAHGFDVSPPHAVRRTRAATLNRTLAHAAQQPSPVCPSNTSPPLPRENRSTYNSGEHERPSGTQTHREEEMRAFVVADEKGRIREYVATASTYARGKFTKRRGIHAATGLP